MKTSALGTVCQINPSADKGFSAEQCCSFVPMEAVDDKFGIITRRQTRRIAEVNKGYTPFHDNDVLVAKITPCMENGKCAIASHLVNGIGFGSTEFHVLRSGSEILPAWIYYFLRQDTVRQEAERNMTGSAGQKRVPAGFLNDLEIPLPPLPEQQRLAALLDKADHLRRTRRYAQHLSDTFLQSVFLEMFGDPATNPKGWDIVEVGEVCDLVRGSSPRPQGDARYFGGPVPRLMIADITRDGMFVNPIIDSLTKLGASKSRLMKAGSVVMAVSGAVGLPAILRTDACIHDGFVGFRNLDAKINPVFLVYLLTMLRTSA